MKRCGAPILTLSLFVWACSGPSGSREEVKTGLPVPFELDIILWEKSPAWTDTGEKVSEELGLRERERPVALRIGTPEEASRRIAETSRPGAQFTGSWGQLAHQAPEKSESPIGSVSLGGSSTGELRKGVPLPIQSPFHTVFQRVVKRDYIYGTEELIQAIMQAAQDVGTRYPGGQLQVGNLSRAEGGDIPQSRSHNSGRDADLAFFALDSRNRSVQPEWYVSYGPDGTDDEGKGLRLDVPRNWAFVESLLLNPRIQVQYIFVAHWIREMLLEHAVRNGALFGVVQRAEVVMRQPGDSSPHSEHFHIRLYCDLNDRLFGCVDSGRRHSWIESWDDAVEDKIARLIEASNTADGKSTEWADQLRVLRRAPDPEDENPYSAEEL